MISWICIALTDEARRGLEASDQDFEFVPALRNVRIIPTVRDSLFDYFDFGGNFRFGFSVK
jgi:hypothetical protein